MFYLKLNSVKHIMKYNQNIKMSSDDQQHTCTYVSAMFGFRGPRQKTDQRKIPTIGRGYCHGLELLY